MNFAFNHQQMYFILTIKNIFHPCNVREASELPCEILQPIAHPHLNTNTWPSRLLSTSIYAKWLITSRQINCRCSCEHPLVIIRDSTDNPQPGNTVLPSSLKRRDTSGEDERRTSDKEPDISFVCGLFTSKAYIRLDNPESYLF